MVSNSELFSDERVAELWYENPRLHARIKDFWVPPVPEEDLHRIMELGLPNQAYDTGLVITRVSPIHFGHIFSFMYGLRFCDKIIIGIGSANRMDSRTPFPVDLRERMLREALHKFGLTPRVSQIVRLNNFDDDQLWFENVMKVTDPFDVVISNNLQEVNRVFWERDIPSLIPPELDRSVLQSTPIRGTLTDEGFIPRSF
jgi:nicotinamide mononucleotide adenylyltransferase